MDLFLHQVVPVGWDPERHLSASYQEAIGTIYLSLHPSPMTMTGMRKSVLSPAPMMSSAIRTSAVRNTAPCMLRACPEANRAMRAVQTTSASVSRLASNSRPTSHRISSIACLAGEQ